MSGVNGEKPGDRIFDHLDIRWWSDSHPLALLPLSSQPAAHSFLPPHQQLSAAGSEFPLHIRGPAVRVIGNNPGRFTINAGITVCYIYIYMYISISIYIHGCFPRVRDEETTRAQMF